MAEPEFQTIQISTFLGVAHMLAQKLLLSPSLAVLILNAVLPLSIYPTSTFCNFPI